ncbi:hypothetical protein DL767_010597 [Monosporascus sp. MG133]|nr:hypothetical protein DL767_010597 [Monosporascus sp. MG133]
MGFDCGFDIFPRLEPTEANKRTYQAFLDEIIDTYQNVYDKEGRREDGKVLQLPEDPGIFPNKHCIQFMVGECPSMPANPDRCDYFLRFSSKVSGRLTTCAKPYIQSVHQIAKKYFGDRVHFWHELNDFGTEEQWRGYYSWSEIHDAHEKHRALETGQGQDVGDHMHIKDEDSAPPPSTGKRKRRPYGSRPRCFCSAVLSSRWYWLWLCRRCTRYGANANASSGAGASASAAGASLASATMRSGGTAQFHGNPDARNSNT